MKQLSLKQNIDQSCMVGNPTQQAAITHDSGPVMCLAGPGSGKTFVLTRHIRYLILKRHVEPHHILVITFSKASAIEMKKRFYELMDQEFYPVRFGTFHAIFFQILSQYEHYKSSDILTLSQKKKYLKTILLQMNYQGKLDTDSLENILSHISYYKNQNNTILFSEIEKMIPQFGEIYEQYDQLIRQEHKLDFDDMMLLCHRLLQKRPDILEEYRKSIEHVLIDEYQDINPIQYQLVKKLIEPHGNLFVVGDDDQSIYGFRGCDPGIMLNFKNQFPDGKIITFPINYRCSQSIVEAAGRVIEKNGRRYSKKIKAVERLDMDEKNGVVVGKVCKKETVHFQAFESKEMEYGYLISELKKKSVTKLCNIACLFRTNMDASYLAEALLREKIPYQMKEKPYNTYDHFISQDFLHYLRLSHGDMSVEEFVPVMNRPIRYISRDAIGTVDVSKNGIYGKKNYNLWVDFDELKRFYEKKDYMFYTINKFEYDLKRMKTMDIFAAINYVRKAVGYDDFLRKYAVSQNVSAEEYLNMADEIQRRMGAFFTLEQLENHIDSYRESSNTFYMSEDKRGVHIMTYHASKGLEFDAVYLPDCNEGIIPYRKSTTENQIEEERRLFYVAMTRAKEQLYILYLDGEKEKHHLVSRFVKEAKG